MSIQVKKLVLGIGAGLLVLIAYVLVSAEPLREEDVLEKGWIRSFESTFAGESRGVHIPFEIAVGAGSANTNSSRFGYFDEAGTFTLNRVTQANLSLAEDRFAEYGALPEKIDIKNTLGETVQTLDGLRGYPFFVDGRIFLINYEQYEVSRLSDEGEVLWSYAMRSPITCVSGAQGALLAGTLDGTLELLSEDGKSLFFFETGGSRIPCIYGVALSEDLSLIACISGLDEQRFILFEKDYPSYRVTYHEFIGGGKRRPVLVRFIDGQERIVYERSGGLGFYEIKTRKNYSVPFEGEIAAIDNEGGGGMFFTVIENENGGKSLAGVRYPQSVFLNAPFKSENVFLRRGGGKLFLGGDKRMVMLEIGKK